MISTHQADQILLRFAGVADEHAQRFLERLRQLRRFGVPAGVPRGRGVASGRSFEQIIETALTIRLLQAGLASSAAARLVREKWALARTVFMLFDPTRTSTKWPEGRPKDVYWIVAPAGLADFQERSRAAEPELATLMLFEGQDLGEALTTWSDGGGSSIILIRAREVVLNVIAAYGAAGVQLPDAAELTWTG